MCDQVDQFLDEATGLCRICKIENCLKCQSITFCKICLAGYFLSSSENVQICKKKITIVSTLAAMINPNVFILEFSERWPDFFTNIMTSVKINVGGLNSSDFYFFINATTSKSFQIILKYTKPVQQNAVLEMKLNPNEEGDENKYYMLEKKNIKAILDEYHPCATNTTWSKSS